MKWKFLASIGVLIGALFAIWKVREKPKYPYELTICAIFKDEAQWLKEWVVYHHDILGFEHFYLYNNDSMDHYKEVLQPFIDQKIVELIDWSSSDESHRIGSDAIHMPYQIGAYNDCLRNRARGVAKWVAFIDIDEFIVPARGAQAFRSYVRAMDSRRRGTMKLSWKIFGTSNVWDLQPGELLCEKLTRRAVDAHHWHQWFKTMVRPEATDFVHVHEPPVIKHRFRRHHPKSDEFSIHHYWSRTEKFCLEKRGAGGSDIEDFNCMEDLTMQQYIPALKKAIAKWDSLQ